MDFTLPQLDGTPLRLVDLRGRPVLVIVFATWAPSTLDDFPVLNTLVSGERALPGFAVVGISVDLSPRDLLPPFMQMVRSEFPVVLADEAIMKGQTPFGRVRAIPTSFLIDPAGRHVETFVGPLPFEHLRRRVRALAETERPGPAE